MRVMMVGVMIGACATTPRQDLVPPLPGPASNARFTAEDMQRETWVERFENPKREVFSKRAAVVEAMQLAPGATVADIGAGTGAYLDVLVDAVGPDGVVVATELSEGFRKGLSDRADAAGWSQVRVRPSRADHCGLDDASVDSALLVDVYHHLDAPVPFVQDLARAITPGGTLVVVDFDPGKPEATEWVKDHVYLTADEMVAQVVGTGLFTLLDRPDVGLVDNAMVRFTRVGSR
ncbi:MAG: class I SAM-dependent methyltransferase [Myxococcota bacterium]